MAPSLNLATLIILPTLLMAIMPQTLARNSIFSPGSLGPGDSLNNGNYRFVMQGDCNLVLYDGNNAIWASGTNGRGSNCRCDMQNDGNLVVYDGNSNAVWASGTNIGGNSYELILQSDRNCVVYIVGGRAIWATGTNIAGTPGVVIEPFDFKNGTTAAATTTAGTKGRKEGKN